MTPDEVQLMIDQSIAKAIDKRNKSATIVTASFGAFVLLLSVLIKNYK